MVRAYRLGQTRDIAVYWMSGLLTCRYRLITLNTIDMQLMKVAEEKRKLERIVTHHERKVGMNVMNKIQSPQLKRLSFDEYVKLARTDAFAGRDGTKPITVWNG